IGASSTRSVKMAATVEIFPCKGIAIEISFAAETPLSFLIPVNNQSYQLYILYRLGQVDQALRIAGFNLVSKNIVLGNRDQGGVELIEEFEPVYQNVPGKSNLIFEEIIKKLLMHPHMIQPAAFQVGSQAVDACAGGGKTKRTCIGHYTGIQAFTDITIDQFGMSRFRNQVIHHFAGRAFACIAITIIERGGVWFLMVVDQYFSTIHLAQFLRH